MSEETKYLKLNDIDAYKNSFNLSNYVWDIVIKWDYFAKDTVGKQFVKAVDSISANIAEGFGRYTKKDKIKFYRYSSGSVYESLDWTQKAFKRKLLSESDYDEIHSKLKSLPKDIYGLINFTHSKLKY
jgi:four helix bundle protein